MIFVCLVDALKEHVESMQAQWSNSLVAFAFQIELVRELVGNASSGSRSV